MTFRAIIIGLLGAVFIAGVCYYNDAVLNLESFCVNDLMPLVPFGALVLLFMVIGAVYHAVTGLKPVSYSIMF